MFRLFLGWSLLFSASALSGAAARSSLDVHDPRLTISVFAEDPDIVTPIGMAIDDNDHIFVIESHTHHPPEGYAGPKWDRIKRFVNEDFDGKPDGISVFAEGFDAGMNLAFSPTGELYILCAREVFAVHNRDGDERSEEPTRILQVETSNNYAHSCLLGITFSRDGWLYVSRGNNGSAAYTIHGTDGSTVTGYGDGGNIVRCRPDGSQLTEFATGFWNPFDLKFDRAGRLICADNDPDARGPNRLVHVVPSGDYGYKSTYGGGGNHPYQGWNGDLPGTLPYISGTGEAPSGLLDANRSSLPNDFSGSILVTIWNENTIERHETTSRGVSLEASSSVLVSGPQDFRPVAIDADSRGNVFITDWVLVDYPNHGRGKIWRLTSTQSRDSIKPKSCFAKAEKTAGSKALSTLFDTHRTRHVKCLLNALKSEDPFVRHAAVVAISRPQYQDAVLKGLDSNDAPTRLGCLMALRRMKIDKPETALRQGLRDSNPEVRRAALQWIGEALILDLRDAIDEAILPENTTPAVFETYLATLQNLDPQFASDFKQRTNTKANRLLRRLDPAIVTGLIQDETKPTNIRTLALTHLENPGSQSNQALLRSLVTGSDLELQRAAIRTIAINVVPNFTQVLEPIALDTTAPPPTRSEAIFALSILVPEDPATLSVLLHDKNPTVRMAAARMLWPYLDNDSVRQAFNRRYVIIRDDPQQRPLVEQLEFALYRDEGCCDPRVTTRPLFVPEWQNAVGKGGDRLAGERVFYSPSAGCSACHTIHNRGGKLGPDLSNLGQSVDRHQIIQSILQPSNQFPPQYQSWFVETNDGSLHQGLQIDHKANGAIELFTLAGKTERFFGDEIVRYYASNSSLMPDGLEEMMSISEFRDLAAYLESLK